MGRLDRALQEREIIITCGTGGVGKTTLSAALAVRAACLGMRTVVITIDPAKRLATSLGIKDLGDRPTDLTPLLKDAIAKAAANGTQAEFEGLPKTPAELKGSLEAIIPDTRSTFEHFVKQLAPDTVVADRIMGNPIFQIFAKEFSGANEYMALERLHALKESRKYDCIILDTPPSRNTLDFLNAPQLLSQFFEERMIRWLVVPTNKLVATGVRKALGLLERLTGAGFMRNLFDFASDLFLVQENFTRNLRQITELLESPRVGFLMVTAPTPETLPEARHFIETLREHRFQFDGLALNRTLGFLGQPQSGLPGANGEEKEAFEVLGALLEREARLVSNLESHRIQLVARVPELARDVHSVEDLFHVAQRF